MFNPFLSMDADLDDVMDAIWEQVDDMMCAGQWAELDRELSLLVPRSSHDLDRLYTIVVATLPGKPHLPSRAHFVEQVIAVFQARDRDEPGLWEGLV